MHIVCTYSDDVIFQMVTEGRGVQVRVEVQAELGVK